MEMPAGGERSFLDPVILGRLGSVELIARTVVEGFLVGLHRSPFQGFSVEFSEYRPYMPGDDTAAIDWKLAARTDRYYVKRFEEETNLECHLLLDVSASMSYGSHALSKLRYGALLAASLAYLIQRQRDGVGLTLFDETIVEALPVSARQAHLRGLLATLSRVAPGRASDVSLPLEALAARLTRRGLVVLISDLLDEPAGIIRGLKHLRFQGCEVLALHTLDPAELTFPFDTPARFADLESADEVRVAPRRIRDRYLAEMAALRERYRRELRLAGIDYHLVDTSTPLDAALMAYLATRSRRW